MIDVVISILAFVAVLSVVVFVHELGHYQVARWCGVKVDAFSIGFGPELAAWTSKAGVRWRIGALPLGGYVKFTGDENAASSPLGNTTPSGVNKASGLFHDQSVLVRSAVTVAGPLFNFIFSIAVFAAFFGFMGETYQRPVVAVIEPGSAAVAAGLKVGDEITSFNGKPIHAIQDLRAEIAVSGYKTIQLGVLRNDEAILVSARPGVTETETPFGDKESQGRLGIGFSGDPSTVETKTYNPISAVGRGIERTGQIITMQVDFIAALIRGAISPGHMSGPLGIGQIAGKVAENGAAAAGPEASGGQVAKTVFLSLVELAAVLSIAIGFMNLLPLPVLDGGHLVFYAAEALRGRPVPDAFRDLSFKAGLACLLMLFVFVTFQDIERLGLFRLLEAGAVAG